MNADVARRDPILRRLVDDLERAFGPRLKSVVLYGSAARGDYRPGSSDLNVIVVLDPLDVPALEAMAAAVRRFARRGHSVPRLFSPALIARSADAFPIEFLDIRAGHAVLHGGDPFAGIEIHPEALRLQIEREIKEKLMLLREAYVMVRRSASGLRRLLVESYPAFAALFRGALHLMGRPVPARSGEVVEAFCDAAGVDRSPFEALARLRRGEGSGRDLPSIFARYHDALTKAADVLDRLSVEGGTRP